MKRILVTGATGFIGNTVCKLLLQKDFEVHAISSREIKNTLNTDIYCHRADLLNFVEIKELISEVRPTHLMHFAWYAVPSKYANAEENLLWVQVSKEILENFKEFGGKRMVFAGTCFEYDLKYGYLKEDTTPSRPNTLYGICKYSFENIARDYCIKNELSFASGRIFYLYGEGESAKRIIPYVINNLLDNKVVRCSHGNQIRDFLNVYDVASAFIEIINSDLEGIVNIGSGKPIKLKEIILNIGKKIGKENLIHFGEIKSAENEPRMIVSDNTKLINNTNWTQKYDLDSGLDITIDWWRKKRKDLI